MKFYWHSPDNYGTPYTYDWFVNIFDPWIRYKVSGFLESLPKMNPFSGFRVVHNNHSENWKIIFAYFMYDEYKQMYFVLFYLLHSFWCCSYSIDGAGRAKKDSISEWMLIVVVVNTFLLNLMINKSLKIDDRKMSSKWFSTVLDQTNCPNNSHTQYTPN